jgi:hypothetical protein
MGNPVFIFSHGKDKKQVRALYNDIGHVWSSRLNEEISFNRVGFQHLVWKGGKQRSYLEQMRRFALIADVVKVIEDPSSQIIERKEVRCFQARRHGIKTVSEHTIRYWAFRGDIRGKNIRAIIRQVDNGKKHFFSVFEEK